MKKFGLPPYYETESAVSALQKSLTQEQFHSDGETLGLVHRGDPNKPVIVFVHGSPGQWDAWADYLNDEDLAKQSYMIAVDRLGFGVSDNGQHEPSLERHAKTIVDGVYNIIPKDKAIIVIGHSYGGPVALRMAVDYPDQVAGLILLAPSIDPDLEVPRWYNHLAALPIVRDILPASVRHSNEEILPLRPELEQMRDRLDVISVPVSVIQGIEDKLVPYQNADYAKNMLVNAEVQITLIEDRGHFIPWQDFDLVKKTLLEFLNKT